MRRSLLTALALLVVFIGGQVTAFADDTSSNDPATEQRNALGEGARYFNVNDSTAASCDGTNSGVQDPGTGKDTPKWHTTLTPPYSLEDFVVEVLRDIAAKEGVPETDTVTQQHVLALVAFAWGEGGNLTNDDIYNPWNTGYNGPGVQLASGPSSSGVQSYASFDDGVEATARVMTGTGGSGGYQSRLGATLKNPSSSAKDFMTALTYFQRYKGNKEWATASLPPNQDSYYRQRLSLIRETVANYKHEASELIGPPGNSDGNNLHSTHALRYSFKGDGSSSGGGSTSVDNCSQAGAVAGNIIQTALNFAWTTPPNDTNFSLKDPKASYKAAVAQYNSGQSDYTDCGVFVATVMHASGVDKNYPASGTSTQLSYVKAHPDKYSIIGTPGQWTSADVQPGDIMISDGHTYIYVGKQSNGNSVAEASQTDHVPEVDRAAPYATQNIGSGLENFAIVRVKS